MMKQGKLTFLLFFFLTHAFVQAQLIVATPPFPAETDQVEIIFNAALGNGGLSGFTGDVYAHTGVLTDSSTGPSNWRHVKTNWGVNSEATRLERIGTDLYKLIISPSVRAYYNVPSNEQIQQMAFVFRSGTQVNNQWLEGKTETGGDIFYDVYPDGLFTRFNFPTTSSILTEPAEDIVIDAISNEADSMFLYMNDLLIKSVAGNLLNHTITAGNSGKNYITLLASTIPLQQATVAKITLP